VRASPDEPIQKILRTTMRRKLLVGLAVFMLITTPSCSARRTDIVDSFDSASKEEVQSLFAELRVESDDTNKAILTLLESTRTITFDEEEMPATIVGLMLLLQRESIHPVFYPNLFALALEEQNKPPREFGWFSPSMLLARTRTPALAPFLMDELGSEDPAARLLATSLLGHMKDKRAIAPLEELFLVEGDAAAAAALHDILEDEMVPILLRACESPTASVRSLGCGYLGNIKRPDTLPVLIRLLAEDADVHVRARAADAMRSIEADAAIAALEKALRDPSPLVRFKAAYTLGRYKGSDAGADILVANLANADDDIREDAARGLIRVTTPEAEGALCHALRNEKVADVRYLIPSALEKHGTPACLSELFLALTDEDDRVRRNADAAIVAVVNRHSEASVQVLKRIAKEGSDVAREKAEELLRRLADTHMVPERGGSDR